MPLVAEAVPNALEVHPATLGALVLFTMISLGLGFAANLAARRGMFLRNYFLGNRTLGPLAVALTAAVMSGGTFMGFPSMVYSFGWVGALWIASYMVFPLTVLGGMGKRIGQLARRTGAITLPDLLRERYASPVLGLMTSLLMIGFLACNLVPQFKAGALILQYAIPTSWTASMGWSNTELYLIGLATFTVTVVAYTTYGGFLAAIWTDVFQSLIMAVGVMVLLPLAVIAAGGLGQGTAAGVAQAGEGFAFAPGAGSARDFLPITLAFSYFFMWAISGMGQPSTMVRLMAFRDTKTLRYAMVWLTVYNFVVYVPIILIFICARAVLPELPPGGSDEVMPRIVLALAHPLVAGLILAAPYGAVLSTVSGFLLIIASGLVRDVYQRWLRPTATERELAWASYSATLMVGVVAALVALNPPGYLQVLIIFTSAGMAAAFLVPALMACYWRGATAKGAISAMAVGTFITVGLYGLGIVRRLYWEIPATIGPDTKFAPYYPLGVDPLVWALVSALFVGVVVSLFTTPPSRGHIALLFDAVPPESPAPATLALLAEGVEEAELKFTGGSEPENTGAR